MIRFKRRLVIDEVEAVDDEVVQLKQLLIDDEVVDEVVDEVILTLVRTYLLMLQLIINLLLNLILIILIVLILLKFVRSSVIVVILGMRKMVNV
jgi:hypothetical protein